MDRERILIAGAGPAGLVSAACLAEAGIPVVVFESEPALPTDLRASTFHPPTLDLLDQFPGVTAGLVARGLIARYWQYRDRESGPVVTWDMDLVSDETNHPYRLQAEQWKLTRLLLERVRACPEVRVLFEHEVTGVSQDGDHAEVTVRTPGGAAAFRGRYVIGAEGANSAVRRSLGVEFAGMTFPELFLTFSTPFDFADQFPGLTYVNYISDPREWFVLLKVPENWRALIPTPPGVEPEDLLGEESVQRCLDRVAPGCGPFEVSHRTLYHVHQRVAAEYRRGRVLLAGDAAHINNPLGGMGMNGGIQDAFNLCAKLVSVWRGEADPALLDRYERQRRAMAVEFVQRATVENRESLRETDPAERDRYHEKLRHIAADPARARAFLLRTSMITGLRAVEKIP